jgi:hypothetical protein
MYPQHKQALCSPVSMFIQHTCLPPVIGWILSAITQFSWFSACKCNPPAKYIEIGGFFFRLEVLQQSQVYYKTGKPSMGNIEPENIDVIPFYVLMA